MFTQRSIRRFKPDSIPLEDIHLILEAAVKAPNGGNQQVARFLVVNDPAMIRDFGELYHEAWWAKRRDEGFCGREDLPLRYQPAAGLADAMQDVPCVMFALAMLAVGRNADTGSRAGDLESDGLAARSFLSREVPFGVFLGASSLVALFMGKQIWSWYFGFYR